MKISESTNYYCFEIVDSSISYGLIKSMIKIPEKKIKRLITYNDRIQIEMVVGKYTAPLRINYDTRMPKSLEKYYEDPYIPYLKKIFKI